MTCHLKTLLWRGERSPASPGGGSSARLTRDFHCLHSASRVLVNVARSVIRELLVLNIGTALRRIVRAHISTSFLFSCTIDADIFPRQVLAMHCITIYMPMEHYCPFNEVQNNRPRNSRCHIECCEADQGVSSNHKNSGRATRTPCHERASAGPKVQAVNLAHGSRIRSQCSCAPRRAQISARTAPTAPFWAWINKGQ